jgi:hypothetical protein
MGDAQPIVRGNRQRNRRVDARELFDADAVVDRRQSGAAVLLRKLNARQPERAEPRPEVARKALRLVPGHHIRTDFCLGELADCFPEQLLFGR